MDLTINERIRKYRKEKDITQKELGEALGMKTNAYSSMEKKGKITVEHALKIAEALDINPDLIIKGEVKKELDFSPIPIEPQKVNNPLINTNPFLKNEKEPQVVIKFTSGEIELSPMEKSILETIQNMDANDRREVIDFINSKRKK